MLKLVGRPLLALVPTLLVVTFTVFLLVEIAPGDAGYALAGENPSPEVVEAIRQELRLDEPLLQRYFEWLGNAVQGDLGQSYLSNQPVSELLLQRLPVTLSLGVLSLLLAVLAGFALGILAAFRPGRLVDRIVTAVSSVMLAIPSFWLALVLVLIFAVSYAVFPTLGYAELSEGAGQWLYHLALPALALAMNPAATIALQLKSALIAEEGSDYLMAARAKGLTAASLMFKHALKNAAVPVVAVLGFRIAALLGGTVIIETIFVLPGLGLLAQQTAMNQDVPVMLGIVTVTTLFVMAVNIVVDASYGLINPKLRGAR
ncbi:ABC transporter permease [Pseudonocardia lacus]|uniref:ABC transporter permease n=1 Tax=Pseudonocardia lacus TaxID=2835865 RepID=UPI001BDBBB07|nr:ABC transporter permease [Pseudonocardia lacus]